MITLRLLFVFCLVGLVPAASFAQDQAGDMVGFKAEEMAMMAAGAMGGENPDQLIEIGKSAFAGFDVEEMAALGEIEGLSEITESSAIEAAIEAAVVRPQRLIEEPTEDGPFAPLPKGPAAAAARAAREAARVAAPSHAPSAVALLQKAKFVQKAVVHYTASDPNSSLRGCLLRCLGTLRLHCSARWPGMGTPQRAKVAARAAGAGACTAGRVPLLLDLPGGWRRRRHRRRRPSLRVCLECVQCVCRATGCRQEHRHL